MLGPPSISTDSWAAASSQVTAWQVRQVCVRRQGRGPEAPSTGSREAMGSFSRSGTGSASLELVCRSAECNPQPAPCVKFARPPLLPVARAAALARREHQDGALRLWNSARAPPSSDNRLVRLLVQMVRMIRKSATAVLATWPRRRLYRLG
jgi:hypothetical protein